MIDIFRKNNGDPFPKEHNARSAAVRKNLKNYQIVQVDGGYEIHTDGEKLKEDETPIVSVETQEQQQQVLHKVTKPWTRASRLDIPSRYKKPGFKLKFVKEDKAGRVRQMEGETWQVCQPVYKINEMILMEIPEENAITRNKFFNDKANHILMNRNKQTEDSLRSIDERIRTYYTN